MTFYDITKKILLNPLHSTTWLKSNSKLRQTARFTSLWTHLSLAFFHSWHKSVIPYLSRSQMLNQYQTVSDWLRCLLMYWAGWIWICKPPCNNQLIFADYLAQTKSLIFIMFQKSASLFCLPLNFILNLQWAFLHHVLTQFPDSSVTVIFHRVFHRVEDNSSINILEVSLDGPCVPTPTVARLLSVLMANLIQASCSPSPLPGASWVWQSGSANAHQCWTSVTACPRFTHHLHFRGLADCLYVSVCVSICLCLCA